MFAGRLRPSKTRELTLKCYLQIASKYWAPQTVGQHMGFDAGIIDQIYLQELRGSKFTIRRIMMLEFSQYLVKLVKIEIFSLLNSFMIFYLRKIICGQTTVQELHHHTMFCPLSSWLMRNSEKECLRGRWDHLFFIKV